MNMTLSFGRILPLLPALLFGALFGCDTQGRQDDFVDDAGRTPEGYTGTNELGGIVSEDRDDWRTSPIYAGKVRVDPAFPNPSFGPFVTIPVSVLEFDAVQGGIVLRAEDGQGSLRLLDEVLDATQPGAYVLRFSPPLLGRTGLIRLFVFDRLGELISYGDLQIG